MRTIGMKQLEPEIEPSSIEKSRKSYQDIISSFKNIHNKLEEWNKQRRSVDKSYNAMVQQHTAKFDTCWEDEDDSDQDKEDFLYEFEKPESNYNPSKEAENFRVGSFHYKRNPSGGFENNSPLDIDKENVGYNFNQTTEPSNHFKSFEKLKEFNNNHYRSNDRAREVNNASFSVKQGNSFANYPESFRPHTNQYEVANTNEFDEFDSTHQSPLKERRMNHA